MPCQRLHRCAGLLHSVANDDFFHVVPDLACLPFSLRSFLRRETAGKVEESIFLPGLAELPGCRGGTPARNIKIAVDCYCKDRLILVQILKGIGMETVEEKGARVNLRLTEGQYDLMRKLGGCLGIELDSQCAKHFFLLGMQNSMSSLITSQNGDVLKVLEGFARAVSEVDQAKQMDLVDEASRARA